MFINPRSGHAPGPSYSDPWYIKLLWGIMVCVISIGMWLSDAWYYLLELLKLN